MRLRVALGAVVVALTAGHSSAASGAEVRTLFADRVTSICSGARLFESSHQIGTREGAIAVSRDIRETGTRRLRRVATVPEPNAQSSLVRRWLNVERSLIAIYARNYLLIWDAIEQANSPAQRASLPTRLHALLHESDALKRQADIYEGLLRVPDCTGGGT